MIYLLFAAALVPLATREWTDAGFIAAVLLLTAPIGRILEFSAQRAASALSQLVTTSCRTFRGGRQ